MPLVENGELTGQGTMKTGFVIRDTSTVTNDAGETVPSETYGNEFVWIPCEIETDENTTDGKLKYNRYVFVDSSWTHKQITVGFDNVTNSYKIVESAMAEYFTEALPENERTSVETYGGYYIGRYEAGIDGYTNVSTNIMNGPSTWTGYTGGKLVIKSGQQVWNYITYERAKREAENLYKESNNVVSKLCSSYGWDTALKFMEEQDDTIVKNYPTKGVGGYSGVEKNDLTRTGYDTTHPCNIYDMSGNADEWTTEICEYSNSATYRGGWNFGVAAAHRNRTDFWRPVNEFGRLGFRVTLYMS